MKLREIKPDDMRASPDDLLQVALQMLAPIVVEPPSHLYFKGFRKLLCSDFHVVALRNHLLREFRRNRNRGTDIRLFIQGA